MDHDYGDRYYTIQKTTKDMFYVVKKDLQFSPDSTASETMSYEDTEINFDSEGSLSYAERCKPVLPNFWIILKVEDNQLETNQDDNTFINTIIVNVYFHCRYNFFKNIFLALVYIYIYIFFF